jgi:uncharacterized membrane protein
MRTHRAEPDRMDALTDGVFSIVATLLVLEVKVPRIPDPHTGAELAAALRHVVPSLVAFALSFLTVMIYWLNHDRLSRVMPRYDDRSRYLNLLLLFFLCLIPFVTAFIAESPLELAAVVAYGAVMLACAAVAHWTFRYLAFGSDLLAGVTEASRRRFARQVAGGPVLYAVAIAVAFASVPAALGLFLIIPLLYLVLPKTALVEADLG